ncbi:YceI family protein [Emticicia fontis]
MYIPDFKIIINQYHFSNMNKKLSITYLILMTAPLFFGCGGTVKEENKTHTSASSTNQGEKYRIDTTESVVTWQGSMLFDFKEEHIGYVHPSNGDLMIDKGQLVGGTVEIDMNTMEYKDKTDTNTPIKHLKSTDYFDVEKFPTSTFTITKVESVSHDNIKVTGDLTIKGITNTVTFPARMELKDGIVKANGKLTFDRTDWGIRYASGKFYDNLADQAVSDDVVLLMEIVAKK